MARTDIRGLQGDWEIKAQDASIAALRAQVSSRVIFYLLPPQKNDKWRIENEIIVNQPNKRLRSVSQTNNKTRKAESMSDMHR
jgi:hypothetical protein